MITIQIEPADNGVVKFLIDDNVNGGGEEYTSRVVYDFDGYLGRQQQVKFLNDLTGLGAYAMMSNRDVGDNFFESRQGSNKIVYFDVTYTAGRRKKNADGSHSAKKAKEILMIGGKNG